MGITVTVTKSLPNEYVIITNTGKNYSLFDVGSVANQRVWNTLSDNNQNRQWQWQMTKFLTESRKDDKEVSVWAFQSELEEHQLSALLSVDFDATMCHIQEIGIKRF